MAVVLLDGCGRCVGKSSHVPDAHAGAQQPGHIRVLHAVWREAFRTGPFAGKAESVLDDLSVRLDTSLRTCLRRILKAARSSRISLSFTGACGRSSWSRYGLGCGSRSCPLSSRPDPRSATGWLRAGRRCQPDSNEQVEVPEPAVQHGAAQLLGLVGPNHSWGTKGTGKDGMCGATSGHRLPPPRSARLAACCSSG